MLSVPAHSIVSEVGCGAQTNAMAVGSTLMYVAPHMTGAIDVVVVRQPDGSLKSSPFYGVGPFSLPGR